jgi:putative ABC transport system ATP-binding protein
MSLLCCRGLTRRPWFEDRDLELQAGEIVFLRGPTGSGKSLFLRALADIDPCDAGEVTLAGRRHAELSPAEWRRNVLYLHQSAPRLPGTVATNLRRIQDLAESSGPVDFLGLAPEADAQRLSGGEAQLLALARAFLLSPRVLLLDEATSAMDPVTSKRVEGLLQARADDGAALLWVTHDEGLASRLRNTRVEAFP